MRVCEKCAQRAAPSLVEFCCASRGTGRLWRARSCCFAADFSTSSLRDGAARGRETAASSRSFTRCRSIGVTKRDKTAIAPGIGEIETFDVCWLLLVVSDCGNRDDRERDRSRGMRTRRGNCARARQFSRLNAI